MRRRAWGGAACLGRPWSPELSSAEAAGAGPGGELGRHAPLPTCASPHGTFLPGDLSLPQDPAPLGPAWPTMRWGWGWEGRRCPHGLEMPALYCLHPRGQGMPKVVKGPELGLMGTGWSAMPASPSSRLISPEELGFIRREKNPKGTGTAGCCSCRDFRLQEGLQDSEEMTRFPLPGFGEWGESRPAWHGKCPA